MAGSELYRILLVDDDPGSIHTAADHMGDLEPDFDVLTDTDPTSALERLDERDGIDCVVINSGFPELSGMELLYAIRTRDQHIPVVGLAGETDENTPSELVGAGATTAFQKSEIDGHTDRLADAVQDAVDAKRRRSRLREGFEFLDAVLNSIDDIVYVTDVEGHPIYWNDAANRVMGDGSLEAQPPEFLDVFLESEHETIVDALETGLETGSVHFETDLLAKDGSRHRYEFGGTTLRDDAGDVIGLCGSGRNITQRHHYESGLRALHRTSRQLFTATSREAIASIAVGATEYIIDNPLCTVFLREGEELVPAAATDEAREFLGELPVYGVTEDTPPVETFLTGRTQLIENAADIEDGRNRIEGWGILYIPLGDFGVLSLGFRDSGIITEANRQLAEVLATNTRTALGCHERERTITDRTKLLAELHGTAQALMQTRDAAEIAAILVTDADEVLGLPATAVLLWDEGALRPVAETPDVTRLFGDLTPVHGPDGAAWTTFANSEARVQTGDLDDAPVASEAALRAQSQLLVPIGEYGVLLSGSTDPDAFSETIVEVVDLLASNAATALEYADYETALETKDQQLEERNEELQRLNRLNSIIRTINQGLIQSSSRTDLLERVCSTFVDVEHYTFTWIGDETPTDEALVPLAYAGTGRRFLDQVLVKEGDTPRSLPETVAEQGTAVAINDVHRDERASGWRKSALNNGFLSMICLPLQYDRYQYGVLEIYANQPGIFTDDEVDVLSELAAHIANAINAVERKESLLTGRETVLEFRFTDIDDPLTQIVRTTDSMLDIDGFIPQGSDAWIVFATIRGTTVTELTDAVEDSTTITNMNLLRSNPTEILVGLTILELSVVDAVATDDTSIQSLRIGPDGGRVSVAVSSTADVRAFIESCQNQLPELELVRRQTTSSDQPTTRLKYDLSDLLTAKQLEVVQTAYFQDYFEWPRGATGVEIAETLDVSPPTFQQHLRRGFQRIFEAVFENCGSESD